MKNLLADAIKRAKRAKPIAGFAALSHAARILICVAVGVFIAGVVWGAVILSEAQNEYAALIAADTPDRLNPTAEIPDGLPPAADTLGNLTAPEPLHVFADETVLRSVERIVDKRAEELTQEDLDELSMLRSFRIDWLYDNRVISLRDIPILFPELRHISISIHYRDGVQLSAEDIGILEEMESLLAVEIFADGLPSLSFAHRFPYVSIRFTEDAYMSDENNLAEASVLGRDFIESRILGRVLEYTKVADGTRVYELIVTSHETNGEDGLDPEDWLFWWNEAKVFVSDYIDGEYHLVEIFDVGVRRLNVTGGLIITDVNFDGQKDLLVLNGHFGNQGFVTFSCFMGNGAAYDNERRGGFSPILNPSLDVENGRVLSTWRNMASSHSWAMYSFVDGLFVKTAVLTIELVFFEDGALVNERRYTDERLVNGVWETEVFWTRDYTEDELELMFYHEDSFWGLYSDKWRTLHNQGTLMDWSIYGGGSDAQIVEIIGRE